MRANGSITANSVCKFFNEQQTFCNVIGRYRTTLLELRCKWTHDSVLLNSYDTIKSQQELEFLVDIEGYTNLSMMVDEDQRSHLAIVKGDNMMLLELTVAL